MCSVHGLAKGPVQGSFKEVGMRRHLLLFLMAVFMVVMPVLSFASPPDGCTMTAAENGQFTISTDVQGASTSYLAEATLDAINDGQQARCGPEENGILTSTAQMEALKTAATTTATPQAAEQAITRSEVRAANLEVGTDITPKSTMVANPVNQIASGGSEVTVVIKWNDATAQNAGRNDQFAEESTFAKNTTTSQIAENAGTTRAPTITVQMRC